MIPCQASTSPKPSLLKADPVSPISTSGGGRTRPSPGFWGFRPTAFGGCSPAPLAGKGHQIWGHPVAHALRRIIMALR